MLPAAPHRFAFRHAHSGDELERGVRHDEQLFDRVLAVIDAAHAGVTRAEDDAGDPRLLDRPAAHRTGLHRGVQGGAGQIVAPPPATGIADRLDFGVRGRIAAGSGAILALAATRETVSEGVFLLSIYSAGLALPFLLTAVGLNRFLAFSQGFRRHLRWVERVAGVLLIAIGVLVFTGELTRLSGYLAFFNKVEEKLFKVKAPTQASAAGQLDLVPDLALPDATGRLHRLRDFEGKVVVINFWATWCLPCKLEIPFFNQVYGEFRAQGVEFIGISLDVSGWKDIEEFQKEVSIEYLVVLGDDKTAEAFGGLPGLPVTIYVDRQGRIARKNIGITDIDELRANIRALL